MAMMEAGASAYCARSAGVWELERAIAGVYADAGLAGTRPGQVAGHREREADGDEPVAVGRVVTVEELRAVKLCIISALTCTALPRWLLGECLAVERDGLLFPTPLAFELAATLVQSSAPRLIRARTIIEGDDDRGP